MKFDAQCNSFFPEKGYGFLIEIRNGKIIRYFFHVTNILSGQPRVGAKAKFDFIQTTKGLAAIYVEFEDAPQTREVR